MTPELKSFIYRSCVFFGSLTLLIILIVKIWPDAELALFAEDGLIESGTAIVDSIAAMLGFYAVYLGSCRGRMMLDRLAMWSIPILSAICALDEISWGARLFDLEMPEMQGGGEFDGLHDVFVILQRMASSAEPLALIATTILIMAILGGLAYRQRDFIAACIHYSVSTTLGRPFASAITLLAFATFLDFGHGRILSSLEEYAELSAGLFLLLAACYSLKMANTNQKTTCLNRAGAQNRACTAQRYTPADLSLPCAPAAVLDRSAKSATAESEASLTSNRT